MQETRKGMLLVLSGPSGVGKGTLCHRLLEEDQTFAFSISVTTRARRENETDGVDYDFITNEQYDELIRQDAFLEHAEVHGNRYGTLRARVEGMMEQGINVVLDIDTQGALNVMKMKPDCVSVFILPPSVSALRARLVGRGTETQETIDRRVSNARGEIALMPHYQYAVMNDDLETAWQQLHSIVIAEKQKTCRYCPQVDDEAD